MLALKLHAVLIWAQDLSMVLVGSKPSQKVPNSQVPALETLPVPGTPPQAPTLLSDEFAVLCQLHLQLVPVLPLDSQLLLQPSQLKLRGLQDIPHR